MGNPKVTIKDVARAAGVTNGTVDRVLHNRAEVSAKTRAKVLQVIKDLEYQTNVYASILAKNKKGKIDVLMPSFREGEFWENVFKGVEQSREYAGRFAISIEVFYYDQYDIDSFNSRCTNILAEKPSGVIVAPMFLEGTRQFCRQLGESGIPYVVLNTSVNVNTHLAYYGLPMYESGYCCADILMSSSDREQKDKVFLIKIARDLKKLSDPTAERRRGFMDYFGEHCPDTEIVEVVIDPNNPDNIPDTLDDAFRNCGGRLNIATLNSRIFLVGEYLETRGRKNNNVVGFDMLERNISALEKGYIRVLICQHSDKQAYQSVVTLTDFLVIGKRPDFQDNYMSIDFLTRYSCRFY